MAVARSPSASSTSVFHTRYTALVLLFTVAPHAPRYSSLSFASPTTVQLPLQEDKAASQTFERMVLASIPEFLMCQLSRRTFPEGSGSNFTSSFSDGRGVDPASNQLDAVTHALAHWSTKESLSSAIVL